MAQNSANIHISAGRIFIGVTPPATGAPPTWLTHTDGVPATGTEVGHTEGDSVFTYKPTKAEVVSEQALGPVDAFVTDEMAQLTFTAQERVFTTLQAALDNIGNVNDVTRMGFYAGNGASLINIFTTCVVLTSRRRDATTKFEVLVIYKAYSVEGVALTYSRTKPSTYAVTLKGLNDTTRNAGDQLFQFSREKP